ncbi:MAG: HAMP domain-containing sensor histidine kinase [Candidatus Paceibacterota bacterium]|jgi:signal transduction histidine kinase
MFDTHHQNLLHFISHEIKGWLTKNEAAFAAIVEGDFGPVSDDLRNHAQQALEDTRRGVTTLIDILNAASHKNGVVSYSSEMFDLGTMLSDVVEKQKKTLRGKNVSFAVNIGKGPFMISGDKVQIRDHVIKNLIDNAVKYAKHGEIEVSLNNKAGKIILAVKDNGVGISEEDMKKLFTEGGRGKNAMKVNAHSTGYGLFIAKHIVDAHNGRIWAESEGEGEGAAFYVELTSL